MVGKVLNSLAVICNGLVWNLFIYFCIESYRGHSDLSWQYLAVCSIGVVAVSKLTQKISELVTTNSLKKDTE